MSIVKIKVLKKVYETKDGGRKFDKYFAPVNIIVKGEEEKGLQSKTLTVKFVREVKPQTGIFVGDENTISLPYIFKQEINPKTGKLEYPVIWIRGYDKIKPLPKKPNTSCVPVVDDDNDEETEF